jgi:HPt (histidine-containing phosphotransfer) domain-containing protein
MLDNNHEVLSSATLEQRRQEMKDIGGIAWLIDLFLSELPNYENELKQAITTKDSDALYLAAHKFRGSCSNLGATAMVELCKELETLGRNGDIEQASVIMSDSLDNEIERLKQALEQER